jgi:transcriptional regulator with XRE-family HTH domain
MPKSLNSPRHELVKSALIEQRKAAGMTQSEVAEKLGRPQSYIAKVEGGERRIDIVELIDLAQVIGLDLGALLRDASKVPGH